MNATTSIKKMIQAITGGNCGTIPLTIGLAFFVIGIVMFVTAVVMLKKAKSLKKEAEAMRHIPPTSITSGLGSGPKADQQISTQSVRNDEEVVSAPAIVPPEMDETTIQSRMDGSETERTDPDLIAPLPDMDMIPPPPVGVDENDATVLIQRKKPTTDE